MLTSPKKQVLLMALTAALAAFSLASITSFTDPYSATLLTFVLFYASVFLFSLGLFTLLGLAIRQVLWRGLYVVSLTSSFRQALLVAILIVVSFVLLSKGLLFWWVELSLILFLAAIEAFFNLKV